MWHFKHSKHSSRPKICWAHHCLQNFIPDLCEPLNGKKPFSTSNIWWKLAWIVWVFWFHSKCWLVSISNIQKNKKNESYLKKINSKKKNNPHVLPTLILAHTRAHIYIYIKIKSSISLRTMCTRFSVRNLYDCNATRLKSFSCVCVHLNRTGEEFTWLVRRMRRKNCNAICSS